MGFMMKCYFWILLLPTVLADSGASVEKGSEELNLARTRAIAARVQDYMISENILVAVLARRGKMVNVRKGLSDVDKYDATGMAHCGFVVRTAFTGRQQYLTLNFVWVKNNNSHTSQLRAWSLEHLFFDRGEKDALLLVPHKENQIKLWNALLDDLNLVPTEVTIGGHKTTRHVISGGYFTRFHNERYNLLSDYVDNRSQNCNEHLVKTLVSIINDKAPLDRLSLDMELHFTPYEIKLSRWKKWIANEFKGMGIKGRERLVGGRSVFKVITVESMVAPVNRDLLGIERVQVFRESWTGEDYQIEDWEGDYVKRNLYSGKRNKTHFDPSRKAGILAEALAEINGD